MITDFQTLGKAMVYLLQQYQRYINEANRALNAGAPALAIECPRGHVTLQYIGKYKGYGGYSRAIKPAKKFNQTVVKLLDEAANVIEEVGKELKVPELADVEIEGVRLPSGLRRMIALLSLPQPKLQHLDQVLARRREMLEQAMKLLENEEPPRCPHRDPETGEVCNEPTKWKLVGNIYIEVEGLRSLANAARIVAQMENILKSTGFDDLMELQGLGTMGKAFLFALAAIHKRPDRPSAIFSYIGLVPHKYCPNCGKIWKPHVEVCPQCGKPTVSVMLSKAVAAKFGVSVKAQIKLRTRAWVLAHSLQIQAKTGKAPAVLAALAEMGSLHYEKAMKCWERAGHDPDKMLELRCASLGLIESIKRYPSRAEEIIVVRSRENASYELFKIYTIAAIGAIQYLRSEDRAPTPWGDHKRYWPPTIFRKIGAKLPQEYIMFYGVTPDEEEREHRELVKRGYGYYKVFKAAKNSGESWQAWKKLFIEALSA